MFIKKEILNDTIHIKFIKFHDKAFKKEKRIKNFEQKEYLSYNTFEYNEIINYAKQLLKNNNIKFKENEFKLEFHRINCGGSLYGVKNFGWHTDKNIISPLHSTYTVIFYLRKDSGIKGGNFLYRTYNWLLSEKHIIEINEKDCLYFDGKIEHRAEQCNGFGCRDSIVVFFNR